MRRRCVFYAFLAVGCGGVKAQIPADLYERLPREERVVVYDRENDLVVARSRYDDAVRLVASTERDLSELSDHRRRTEARLKKANLAARIDQVRAVINAKSDYVRSQLKVAHASEDSAEAEIVAAAARLEQAKQRQLVRSGLAEAATLNPFDKEVRVAEARSRAAQSHELDLKAEAQKQFESWKKSEDLFARATADFDSTVWID